MELLSQHYLDFKLCDPETGDTTVRMVCDQLKEFAASEITEGAWRACKIAARAAACLKLLVHVALVDPGATNKCNVSGMDVVKRVMDYSGEDVFFKVVADCWQMLLLLDGKTINISVSGTDLMFAKYSTASPP